MSKTTTNALLRGIIATLCLIILGNPTASAQLQSSCEGTGNGNYTIRIDTVFTDIGIITSPLGSYDLTGFNTYRLYLVCEAADDLLQAVAGDAITPTSITTTTSFFQEPNLATATENGLNPLLFPAYPELQHDSFVTIGLTQTANAGAGETATAISEDASLLPINGVFENGGNIVLNSVTGGAWYVTNAELASNSTAGGDLEVLFAQLTTDGELDGQVLFQVYRDGIQDGSTCIRPHLEVNPFNASGCTDPTACNYDASAFVDDGTCDFCSCPDTTIINSASFPDDSLGTYFLEWDVVANHDTSNIAALAGTKTYRAYIRMADPLDTLSAIYGNSLTPASIVSTTSFYQSVYGGLTPNSIQPVLYPFYPDLQYDSWITIGIENVPVLYGAGYGEISTIGSWLTNAPTFDPAGGDIVINDLAGGTWFQFPGSLNGVPDADQRVLIGQFTTSGVISGTVNVQILPQFLPADDDEYRLTFNFTTENLGVPLTNYDEELCGCLSDSDGDGICDSTDQCSDLSACNYDDTENAPCETLDILGVCGGNCTADADDDQICDDVDPCVGSYDACGICNGPGAIYDCGCFNQPAAWCDCNGNTLDALGVCGGDCAADANNNGICDVDEVLGCTNADACNFNDAANIDDGSCLLPEGCETCSGATDGTGTILANDADGDGICDADEVAGCQDDTACNFNALATDSDDSCIYVDGICDTCVDGAIVDNDTDNDGVCDADEVAGCQDDTACNFNALATDSDDSCIYVDGICDTCVDGAIVDNDSDNDGVCDADEVAGCQDDTACNFNALATDSDDSCIYVDGICDTCVDGAIVDNDSDNDGVCDADEVAGCQDDTACNFNALATDSDGSCVYLDGVCDTCEGGVIVDNDADNDGVCDADEIAGCQDDTACNFNALATDSDDSCVYVDGICDTCVDGAIVDNDVDNDGVCDADEVAGCQDDTACNFNALATDSDDSCVYVDGVCETCEGGVIVDNDSDNDGVCDADEVAGCQDDTACNFNPLATDSDDSCVYVDGVCETCEGGVIVDNDSDNDGVCDADEVAGCQDDTACNFNPLATDSDDSCIYVDGICDTCVDGAIVDNDSDDDGVCDADEVAGCQDATACNFNALATDSDDSCVYVDGICDTCVDGAIVDNDSDNDGVCDADEVAGCQDDTACNFNALATDSDDSCIYVDGICDTCVDGAIVDNDTDNDGVCDADEVAGCQDDTACNFNPLATDSDDSCVYVDGVCETCEGGVIVDNDSDNDGVCDADEIAGCQDDTACNFNALATDSDDSCVYVDGICDTCVDGAIVDNDSDNDGVCDADEIAGCQDDTACNFNALATDSDDSCVYVDGICDTCLNGQVIDNDADDDGICDADEVAGCTDPAACNVGDFTDTDNSLCVYVDGVCDTCEGGVVVDNDADDDGVCDADEVAGCQDDTACNFNALATDSDDSCVYVDGVCETCEGGVIVDNDSDNDGVCNADEIAGCQDDTACNFNALATDSDDSCVYVDGVCETCEGGVIVDNDSDNDGVCNADEIAGCQDDTACNFNALATDSDDSCIYVDGICDTCVDGIIVDNDADNDGVCDADEVAGCQDATACNFNAAATDADDSCVYVDGICDTCVDGAIVDNDADNDGICDADETAGCTDPEACNVGNFTDTDNALCIYVDGVCETCEGGVIVDNDADDDGVCDADEVAGCQDDTACNYNAAATDSDDSCVYVDGICDTCVDGAIVDNDSDNDGVCDADEIAGCQDDTACNFNALATDSDDSCVYVDGICETCEGGVVVDNDADDDGVCDADEVAGCQDDTACNYNAAATDSDDSCLYDDALGVCGGLCLSDLDNDGICDDDDACVGQYDALGDCNGTCQADIDNDEICDDVDDCIGTIDALGVCNGDCAADVDQDGVCDVDEIPGCTDATACNFDPSATDDDFSCTFVDGLCDTCVDGTIVDNDSDDDGVCDADEVAGCQDDTACNFNALATDSDDSCVYVDGVCETCVDGAIVDNDSDDDGVCDADEVAGCQDDTACNYNALATDSDDSCVYVDGVCETCEGGVIVDNDADDDGVCDSDEVAGCQDDTACNFNPLATDSDGSCQYDDALGVCGGDCAADADGDGICDDVDACVGAYDALGDCNGTCQADVDNDDICDDIDDCVGTPDAIGVCNGDCLADVDQDGVCDVDEVPGCTDQSACNYDPLATDEDGSCASLDAIGECGGSCSADADEDGICDDVDDCVGAVDAIGVCNGDCTADTDGDGICDSTEIFGCTDETACNYDPTATEEDGSCTTLDVIGVCGGDCTSDLNANGICDLEELECPDFNGNGVCDGDETFGCTYFDACNYDADATADDGSCNYPLVGFDCDGNSIDSSELFYGCTYPEALNYSAAADLDNGSCVFLNVITDLGACYFDVSGDGIVNTPDLLILLQYWEATCE